MSNIMNAEDKKMLSESIATGMEAMFGNEQMQKLMRMQLAAQILSNSNLLKEQRYDKVTDDIEQALSIADVLMKKALV